MLRKELVNVLSKEKHTVSFFEDDSVETVREQLAKSANSHPDKMFVLVSVRLKKDYYTADPRNWENLFERLSYNGRTIEKSVFDEYQTNYRFPNTRITYSNYDRGEWMSYPPELKPLFATECTEYRIFGVSDDKSFVLPLEKENTFMSRIPAKSLPRPDNTILVSSYYSVAEIDHFAYKVYGEGESAMYYYPYLRPDTPNILSDEAVRLLEKNAKLLTDLLDLKIPKDFEHSAEHILHTRFYIPWVGTDFGSAVSTRFEQMFYGLTVSSTVPYIGFFTSKDEINRHKFFTNNPKTEEPYLNMSEWKTWWSLAKPARARPTLILYRGKSKHHFDRVLITSEDMIVSTYRPETNTETLEELKKSCEKWIKSFDAVIPFLDEKDTHPDRWELQEVKVHLSYPKAVDDLSILRFNCISPFFSIANKNELSFTLLRTDRENSGVTSIDAKLIQMAQEGPLNSKEVAQELSITQDHASKLINDIMSRREENNRLGNRLFKGYPTIIIGPQFITIKGVKETKLSVQYADILRYILSNPDSDELDKICPARMQTITAEAATIHTNVVDEDAVIDDAFADLLDDFDEVKEEPVVIEKEEGPKTTLDVAKRRKTSYSYFANRLRTFDPETFVPEADFARQCEKTIQPVILKPADKKRLAEFESGKYDPITGADAGKVLDVSDPDGSMVCPEYWCTKDEIPLRGDQLISEDGTLKCPVCRGKLETSTTSDPREFPLIKRKEGHVFPRPKYKSPGNGKDLPCCYSTNRTKRIAKTEIKDKYYVFLDSKSNLPELRLAKLDKKTIEVLDLGETYDKLDNQRVFENSEGFFRIGLGHASKTLPQLLGMSQKIPYPREAVSTVMKCSFMRSWSTPTDTHAKTIYEKLGEYKDTTVRENIARIISGIDDAFSKKELSPIQELEYSALSLNCDLFRINMKNHTVSCLLYSSLVKPRSRGIIVLQKETEIDIIASAKRTKNAFVYQANIFEEPFKRYASFNVSRLRNKACMTEIPSYNDAKNVCEKLFTEPYSVILDPFGRGQALYIANKLVLPFQSSVLPDTEDPKLWGFFNLHLPTYDQMKEVLVKAGASTKGYEFQEGLYDSNGKRVEILTASGLRIPIKPEKVGTGEPRDIIETVNEHGEPELMYGKPNPDLLKNHSEISYDAEVFEFLIFQLSKDLENDEYSDLRATLRTQPPKRKDVESQLKKWFDKATQFVDIKESADFISKIRAPCGQFKSKKDCKGNLCGWDGKVCRIQIKKSVKEDKLFNRLFSAVFDNSKIRAVVLDGRTTPFFSTILYIKLPHEIILTDKQL
jgi:hypothetical protein